MYPDSVSVYWPAHRSGVGICRIKYQGVHESAAGRSLSERTGLTPVAYVLIVVLVVLPGALSRYSHLLITINIVAERAETSRGCGFIRDSRPTSETAPTHNRRTGRVADKARQNVALLVQTEQLGVQSRWVTRPGRDVPNRYRPLLAVTNCAL